jgi:hypothetical protein
MKHDRCPAAYRAISVGRQGAIRTNFGRRRHLRQAQPPRLAGDIGGVPDTVAVAACAERRPHRQICIQFRAKLPSPT